MGEGVSNGSGEMGLDSFPGGLEVIMAEGRCPPFGLSKNIRRPGYEEDRQRNVTALPAAWATAYLSWPNIVST